MLQFSSLTSVMEAETISKNGASPKSQMSRNNHLLSFTMKNVIHAFLMSLLVVCCTTSCKKDSGSSLKRIEFDEDEITMSVGTKYTPELFAVPSSAKLPECTFSSDDRTVATVSRTSGEITAVATGEAVITAKTSDGKYTAECFVTVVPAGSIGTLYREPYLTFGASKTSVKNYETRELAEDKNDILMYWGENNNVLAVAYSFEANKMDLVLVVFENVSNIKNKAITHLSANYEYLGEEDGEYFFATSDEKIGIMLFYDDEDLDSWVAVYIDISSLKSSKPLDLKMNIRQKSVIPEHIFNLLGN